MTDKQETQELILDLHHALSQALELVSTDSLVNMNKLAAILKNARDAAADYIKRMENES